jgi:hypothetical protein
VLADVSRYGGTCFLHGTHMSSWIWIYYMMRHTSVRAHPALCLYKICTLNLLRMVCSCGNSESPGTASALWPRSPCSRSDVSR